MTKNIAHRGFSSRYPENTMLAFEKALETGCDGMEFDVHMTKDGQIVVIHDESVDRTTNGSGLICEMTLEQLRAFDAGRGERIPTLDEYFDLVATRDFISNIELKNSLVRYPGIEAVVIEKVRQRGLCGQVIISSFNHFSILECKRLAPEIRCGFLTGGWPIDIGAYTKKHGIECVHPEYHGLTDEAIAEIHGHGLDINTYTVNDPAAMRRLASFKVAAIITDNPVLLGEVLAGK